MSAASGAEFEYSLANPEFGEKAHQELNSECSFEYQLAHSQLYCRKLSFYPEGTWLCRLELDPQIVRRRGRRRELTGRTNYYFIFRPSDQNMPIMPLGNDTVWVLRANKHYGLDLRGRIIGEDDPGPIGQIANQAMMRRIIEYLHFYYDFTRYDAYAGGPMRFRVPRTLADLRFSGGTEEDQLRAMGALWRFLDREGTDRIQPAIGTVTRFIDRYHADVPIQVASALWRLRVSVRLNSGYVRLYGRVPFFHSPHLLRPPADRVELLPTPRHLYRWEPWLLLPERVRSGIGALTYLAVAVSWLIAVLVASGFPLTYLIHPAIVAGMKSVVMPLLSAGWERLWWCSVYAIVVFGVISTFVFQFDGMLNRAARTAPGILQAAYKGLDKIQKYVWRWFRPRLETLGGKILTAALWLIASAAFLIFAFTTLQIAQEPARFATDVKGHQVLQTFFGHATIAFPGLPYLLGAIGLDPLPWLQDPAMTSKIVLFFRFMMLIIVFRAFWKLLGYTSPRVLYRDSRRLEFEFARAGARAVRPPPQDQIAEPHREGSPA
jgi:hypothetical protein